jgi:hypothetical protein
MPEGAGGTPESEWLLEPAGPGEAQVEIGIGSEVELSPEALAALERLMASIEGEEEDEVAGFAIPVPGQPCQTYRICNPFGNWQPRETSQCLAYVHCRIGSGLSL